MPLDLQDTARHWLANLQLDLTRYVIFSIGVWLVLWVILAKPLASRRLREERPVFRQLILEFLISVRSIAIFSTVGLLIYSLSMTGHLPGPAMAERWGTPWALTSWCLMVVGHDAWFYWTHRAMHSRRLFRTFHRRHHRSNNPSPFTAYSFDLAEAAVNSAFIPVWMILIPTPWPVLGFFVLHQIARNTIGHCGYEIFPSWGGRPLFPFLTTVTHHDLHHAQAGWNYGLYFSWWDRLMGTEHPQYLDRFAKAVAPREALPTASVPDALP